MGHRLFVAVVPPDDVREDLADFLDARPGTPWIHPDQWHVTLAFSESVAGHRVDEYADLLATYAVRHAPFALELAGGGVFPSVERARVLWCGVDSPDGPAVVGPDGPLARLAGHARSASNAAGCPPDGKPFHPHLTLARLTRRIEATRWLRVLDTYRGPAWTVDHVDLVASHLREGPHGRPRHEDLARLPLGG